MPVFFFTFFGLRFAHLTDAGGFSMAPIFWRHLVPTPWDR